MAEKMCRLCLTTTKFYRSLLLDNIAEILNELTSITVTESDPYPKVACNNCIVDIRYANCILRRFIRNDKKLKEELVWQQNNESLIIKQEFDLQLEAPEVEFILQENDECLECLDESKENLRLQESCESSAKLEQESLINVDKIENVIQEANCQDNDDKIEIIYDNVTLTENLDPQPGLINNEKLICCGREFSSKNTFRRHKINIHERAKCLVPCKICNKSIFKYGLKSHMENAHNMGKQFICEDCGKVCKSREAYSKHYHVIHRSAPDKHKCPQCARGFRTITRLKMHFKRAHDVLRDHICEKCGKGFFSNAPLNRHINSMHTKIVKFSCPICNKGFFTRLALKKHKKLHAINKQLQPIFKCEFCGIDYKHQGSYKSHMKVSHKVEVENLGETSKVVA